MKNIFKVILALILIILVIFIGYLIFMTVTDYRPKDVTNLKVENNKNETLNKNKPLSVLTYNIGYCGLDEGRDFFMDGGSQSRSESKEKTLGNLKGIIDFLDKDKSDFILLQEVDIKATRSYEIDEYSDIKNAFKEYGSNFGVNYKVPWVPVPILKPHGKVEAGLVTLSKYNIKKSDRYQYPGKEKWPRQLCELDRCFTENRLKVDNGKELILINSHLSAYDKGGLIRKQQLGFLKEHIKKEYNKGNYVIVGGDWNHVVPGTDPNIFENSGKWPEWLKEIPDSFKPEGFKWAADALTPSNRTVDKPYKKGENYLSVIDGFLVSPNVNVKSVKGYSLEFKNSDHNPVRMEFVLE